MRDFLRRNLAAVALAGILFIGAGVSLLLLAIKTPEQKTIAELVQECALLFNARDWDGLSRHAWPVSEQPAVMQRLKDREGLRVSVATPVKLGEPRISADRASIDAHVDWSMAMGRLRDSTTVHIRLVKEGDRWMVDASSMDEWRP